MSSSSKTRRDILIVAAGAAALLGTPALVRAQAKLKLKFSSTSNPVNPIALRLTQAFTRIRTETNGEVDITLFPSGQLGGEIDSMNQLRNGAIDFTPLSSITLSTILPPTAVSGVGFAFANYDQVWAAMDGDLGDYMRAQMAKVNLVGVHGVMDYGFRHMTATAKPIRNPADLANFKMRVPPGPLWTSLFKALGAAPTTVPIAEVYAALRSGVIDGTDLPLLTMIVDLKIHEVQKYISLTSHMWDGPWILANKAMWEGMSKAQSDMVAKHLYQAAREQRADVVAFDANFNARIPAGLTVVKGDSEAFRQKLVASGFYGEWKGKLGNEVWSLLEKYTGKLG